MWTRIAAAAIAATITAGAADAATISWATWSNIAISPTAGSATGTTSAGTFTYTGELENFFANYPSWGPASSYVGGIVGNAPPQANGIIQIFGGTGSVNTIVFATPVVDPVMAIWSLGQPGITPTFNFDQVVAIQAGGLSNEYAGSSIFAVSPSSIGGTEGNGTIRFFGTVSSITWTNPTPENWYGFTVGVSGAVPEPATWAMMLLGLAGVGFLARRSRARSVVAAA